MFHKLFARYKNRLQFNTLVLLIILILGTIILYFFYYRWKNRTEVYVLVYLSLQKMPIPYWVADSIEIGDKDITLISGDTAIVVDKEVYEAGGYGKNVFLTLKISATKGNQGFYLFKSKPLLVGEWVDLKFPKGHQGGFVTYLGLSPPKHEYEKFIISIIGRGARPETVDAIKIDDEIVNNKGQVLARILDKKVTFAEVRVNADTGVARVSYDKTTRDVIVVVEILVEKVGDTYLFQGLQKLKVNESIDLHFKNISLYEFRIMSIEKSK